MESKSLGILVAAYLRGTSAIKAITCSTETPTVITIDAMKEIQCV